MERVRLERVVVTERRTITIDVSHEEVRLIREPLTGAADADHLASPHRTPIVMILREEQVQVTKTTVPVERVTLHVETEFAEQNITEHVRREHIDYHPSATKP